MCGKANPTCSCSSAKKKKVEAAEALLAALQVDDHEHDEAPVVAEAESVGAAAAASGENKTPEPGLIAALATDPATDLPSEWHGVLIVEGLRTTDHRLVASGALTWRQLPLAICAQFEDVHGYGDIPPSPIVGSITSIKRDEATGQILAEGTFDLTLEEGQQAASMCKNQTLRWNSVDLEILASQYVEVLTDSGMGGAEDVIDILLGDPFDEPAPMDWYDEVTEARIMKTTLLSTPAFPQAVVAPIDVPLDVPEPMGAAPVVTPGLVASGVTIPVTPPASWFSNPELTEPTPLEITDDGRVFGHVALFDTCHMGFSDTCVAPPRSEANYAHFHTGVVACENGDKVRVGHITFNTGHAGLSERAAQAAAHYDHTGAVAADIACGEDEFGIWFAGSLRPGLSDEEIRAVRAAPLSGDWRNIGGGMELVACLSVNVPGFAIVASAGRRNDEQVSLIAAAVKRRNPLAEIAREVAVLRAAIAPLRGQAIAQLNTRVNGEPKKPDLALVAALSDRVNAEAV